MSHTTTATAKAAKAKEEQAKQQNRKCHNKRQRQLNAYATATPLVSRSPPTQNAVLNLKQVETTNKLRG